jgi:hypothetical protein
VHLPPHSTHSERLGGWGNVRDGGGGGGGGGEGGGGKGGGGGGGGGDAAENTPQQKSTRVSAVAIQYEPHQGRTREIDAGATTYAEAAAAAAKETRAAVTAAVRVGEATVAVRLAEEACPVQSRPPRFVSGSYWRFRLALARRKFGDLGPDPG